MALTFAIGSIVDENLNPMKGGEVVSASMNPDGSIYFNVRYTNSNGEVVEGFYPEEMLKAVV